MSPGVTPGTDASPLAWLETAGRQRAQAGLRRSLRPRSANGERGLLDLASNDYLGLSGHPSVVEAGVGALRAWGAGSTGSRLVTGDTELHQRLESELAGFVGAEAALVFSSGYTANLAAVAGLSGPGSLVVSDAACHASLVDACRLSRARVVVTPHRDADAVAAALAARGEERAVVVTDSVFSTDGALAPLRRLHEVCREHRAVLLVDEAHGLGVRGAGGRGLLLEAGLAGAPDVVMTATLSKALGSQGGAVLGPEPVRDHLINTARPFIFDTGLAPAAAGSALAALQVLIAEPWRAAAVLGNAAALAQACGVAEPQSAVVSVIRGTPEAAVAAAAACLQAGVLVGCFRPPSVPPGTSRLRLTARASLTAGELDFARRVLSGVLSGAPSAEA
ncbi:MAG: 8-amino-7-oxononanoate synthase [Mycobacterium sp.]